MPSFQRAALLLSLAWLTACDKPAPSPASPPAPAVADTSAPAPTDAVPPKQEAASGCQSLAAWRQQGKGEFEVLMQRTEAGFQVQMQLVQGGQHVQDAVLMPAWAEESITIGDEDIPEFTTICANRWFVLNLPSERGGSLIVGERLNGGLAMYQTGYESSDEDTATITWGAGMPMVSSGQPGAPWPLEPLDEKAVLAPGTGAPVELQCESRDQARGEQSLSLQLDSAGRLSRIGYFSVVPEGMSCSVDARRSGDDPQTATTWQDAPHQATIRWGEEAPDASTLVITRRDGRYTVDTRELRLSEFCGQSTEIVQSITLRPGAAQCQDLQWPDPH